MILVAIGLVLLLFAGVGTHVPQAMAMRSWLVLSGGLIDVGGYRLRIDCQGSGKPTVIMDAGLSQPKSTWGQVPAYVAKITRVCTYERAGVGESETAPGPRNIQHTVDDLDRLLVNAVLQAPYILVGHSFGGLNVQLYSRKHPNNVVGVVLVDSSHRDQFGRFAALMPASEREEYLRHEGGRNGEGLDLVSAGRQVQATASFPIVPLVVLSAGPGDSFTDVRMARVHGELQAELARLTPNAVHIIAEGSGHFIQLDRPELVIDAILSVVEAARK